MSFPNIYHHRKVAETASKSCDICYKPSTSVLVTPENKDFFYVCAIHLKDRGFCNPIIDEAAVAAKKKKEMDEEVLRVKEEFEEKQRKKKEKEKEEKEKEKDKDKDNEDDKKKDSKDAGKEKEDTKKTADSTPILEEEPRTFALQKAFYQQRLDKKRNAEIAKRNQQRLQNPGFFPQVPKDLP
ncbi:hypothetical protein PVAG01_01205 [Phlyctema vagabunda]|uniref:VPS4-associated protein 1 n=1 Tax=Phlyctema vagabunda TaxID=108571 RepID=A0ABR4PWH2_9HELO